MKKKQAKKTARKLRRANVLALIAAAGDAAGPITRDGTGGKIKDDGTSESFTYCTLEAIQKALKKPLADAGLRVLFNDGDSAADIARSEMVVVHIKSGAEYRMRESCALDDADTETGRTDAFVGAKKRCKRMLYFNVFGLQAEEEQTAESIAPKAAKAAVVEWRKAAREVGGSDEAAHAILEAVLQKYRVKNLEQIAAPRAAVLAAIKSMGANAKRVLRKPAKKSAKKGAKKAVKKRARR